MSVAAEMTGNPIHANYAAESRFLKNGKLTLITGASKNARSRFIFGMLSGIIGSNRIYTEPVICCYNRRWADWQAMKVLLLHAARVHMSEDGGSDMDAWIMAIEHIEHSGMLYDTTRSSIEEICRTVRMEQDKNPGKLLIVDGLEYFQSNSKEEAPLSKLPEMLDQLRTLAQETMLPVIASSPPLHLSGDPKFLAAAD